MIGWISSILAMTAVILAFLSPVYREFINHHLDNPLAFTGILLMVVLLAFVLGRRASAWSGSRQVSSWVSTAAAVIIMGLHFSGNTGPVAPPAAPVALKKAPAEEISQPVEEEEAEAIEEPIDDLDDTARLDSEEDEITYDSEEEALNAPVPGGPRQVIVRNSDGEEFPLWLNPGEKIPPGLERADAVELEGMPMAQGAWAEIESGGNGHFFVTADINNTPIKAVIDTGASAVALSYDDAEAAGINTGGLDYTLPVNTANGTVKAAQVILRRVEIDGVMVRDVRAWVLPEGAMRGTLIGMSFLRRLSGFEMRDGRLILKQ